MNIQDIAAELWRKTEQGPASQWINVEGHRVQVTCARTSCNCGCHIRYTFSMTNGIPHSLHRRIRGVFIPEGVMYPSESGIEYVQEARVSPERMVRRILAEKLTPLPPPSGEDYRASGDALCPVCDVPIRLHPMDPDELSYDKQPFLHVLCNGDRVKT